VFTISYVVGYIHTYELPSTKETRRLTARSKFRPSPSTTDHRHGTLQRHKTLSTFDMLIQTNLLRQFIQNLQHIRPGLQGCLVLQ
jgi:hypothetical protein